MTSKFKTLLLVSLTLLFSGCASTNEIHQLIDNAFSPSSADKPTKMEEISYSTDCHCFKYGDIFLFNISGGKVRTKEEAAEWLQVQSIEERRSTGERVAAGVTSVYVIPVSLLIGIVNEVALIPASPYTYYKKAKDKKDLFDKYVNALHEFEKGNYSKARLGLLSCLRHWQDLRYYSNVYFKIGETYEKDGQMELARKYYELFLNYSIALYPAFFAEYDASYKNDFKMLDKALTIAETKLAEERL